ncbi:MAG: T9SS type A sorting domain-containing protein [Chloroherpetonaceae bacterium]|nr:T9SS type A sorting domain-containing protein [Chloroherpetonaceae bacterium]MDW8437940.1 T9SS type A sorting domain-containing protein [Chloroherpetonaceae bacterium]
MKRFCFLALILLTSLRLNAQQASTFFPSQNGYKWFYQIVTLDTLQNPIAGTERTQKDSLAGEMLYQGKTAKIILTLNGALNDTSFVSLEGTNAFQYVGADIPIGDLPPALGDSLQALFGWYATFRFAQPVNQNYTLLSRSFTVPLDSSTNLPLVITVTGRRLSDQTVTVPFGTFQNAKRFLITTSVGAQVLPPPFPALPLFSIPDTTWIAQGTWIVRRVTPTVNVNLSTFGVPPFTLPGQRVVLAREPLSASPSPTPVAFELAQNYPNPFNPTTVIPYRLSAPSDVRLEVFDMLGRKVATLVDARQGAGSHRVAFNAAAFNLSSGMYFYKLSAGAFSETRKMIFSK